MIAIGWELKNGKYINPITHNIKGTESVMDREILVDAVKSYIHWNNLAHTNPEMMLSFPSKEVRDECAMIMENMDKAFKRMEELVK